jgi:hypothetical protein
MPGAVSLSVIICTHNPRSDYFGRTLEALRAQILPFEKWEMLVIDNHSKWPVQERFDFGWHPGARVVREDKLGLTPARLRGIAEAQGDLLVFVDDDNVLDPDFLDTALRIAAERPFLGSWSGQCRPCFEEQPAEWTRRYWGNLVIRQFDTDVWSNLPRLVDTMPCGAGLCIRRDVARHYLALNQAGQRSVQLDRTGTSLLSGGDNDLAACACDVGLGVGLVSALKLTHLIPPVRLTEDYLTRLAEGIAYSAILLDRERGITHPPRGALGHIADLVRTSLLAGPHRRVLRAAYRGRDRAIEELTRRV